MKQAILIIDDDQDMRDLYTEVFGNVGYAVVTALDSTQGLEAIRRAETEFTAVFTGLFLPGEIKGVELIRQARQITRAPIFLWTGGIDPTLDHKVEAAGGQGVLRKPYFTSQEVLELISSVCA